MQNSFLPGKKNMSQVQEKEVTEMFNTISKTYDRVNAILSFGIDKLWRKKLLSSIPPQNNQRLLDIATGTGDVILQAVDSKKIQSGIGLDLAQKMLDIGALKAQKKGISKQVTFQAGNALDLPFKENTFDCATCSFGIRNVQNVPKALQEAYRILKPTGRLLILEFSLPKNTLLKTLHLFYLRSILPKVGGYFSKSPPSYAYLNKTIESFPYGEAFLTLMRKAGFKEPSATPLLGGIATLYQADKNQETA